MNLYLLLRKLRQKNTRLSPEGDLLRRWLDWVKANSGKDKGILLDDTRMSPGLTALFIPTLMEIGERDLAAAWTKWLISLQQEQGAFPQTVDLDNVHPAGIDTPQNSTANEASILTTIQVTTGILAGLNLNPRAIETVKKSCDWICENLMQEELTGNISPTGSMKKNLGFTKDILFSCCSLFAGVVKKFNDWHYILFFNGMKEALLSISADLDYLDTFIKHGASVFAALLDIGETKRCRDSLQSIAYLIYDRKQNLHHQETGYPQTYCFFHLAALWFKLDDIAKGSKAFQQGLYNNGSNLKEEKTERSASLFPRIKYFIDAHLERIDSLSRNIPDWEEMPPISPADGRYKFLVNTFSNISGNVLEVGCGNGRYSVIFSSLPRIDLYGCDIKLNPKLSTQSTWKNLQKANALSLPYRDAYFDGLYCVEVLEHTVFWENAVREIARVVHSGGKIVIIDKNISKWGIMKCPPWETWFDPREVGKVLSNYCREVDYTILENIELAPVKKLIVAWTGVKA